MSPYLAAGLARLYAAQVVSTIRVPLDVLTPSLRVAAGAGTFLFFAGLVAALGRANRAAGHSPGGVAGQCLGLSCGAGLFGHRDAVRHGREQALDEDQDHAVRTVTDLLDGL